MAEELTTLQLARRIADAVKFCDDLRSALDFMDPATQAVINTLHDTGSWFCRLREDDKGSTVQVKYDDIQPSLFP